MALGVHWGPRGMSYVLTTSHRASGHTYCVAFWSLNRRSTALILRAMPIMGAELNGAFCIFRSSFSCFSLTELAKTIRNTTSRTVFRQPWPAEHDAIWGQDRGHRAWPLTSKDMDFSYSTAVAPSMGLSDPASGLTNVFVGIRTLQLIEQWMNRNIACIYTGKQSFRIDRLRKIYTCTNYNNT